MGIMTAKSIKQEKGNKYTTNTISKKNPFSVELKKNYQYTDADKYVLSNRIRDIKKIDESCQKINELYQQAVVKSVIWNDNHKSNSIDISRVLARIIAAAEYAELDAGCLACIVKKESHFKEVAFNKYTGKTATGLTSSSIKDLYNRAGNYDLKLEKLIKKYGNLTKVFIAKQNNTTLDLGNFGNLLYEYSDWKNLYNEAKKDYDLTLKLGAFVYKYHLNNAKTNANIRLENNEKEAFKNYNNSFSKDNYASLLSKDLKDARAIAKEDEKYLAALNNSYSAFAPAI